MISTQTPEDGTTGCIVVGTAVIFGTAVGTVVGSGVGAAGRVMQALFCIFFRIMNPPAVTTISTITMIVAANIFERFRTGATGTGGRGDPVVPGELSAFCGSFKRSRTIFLAFLAFS